MFDYADKVRSLSQGRASPSLEPHSYRPAPPDVLDAMLHPEDFEIGDRRAGIAVATPGNGSP